MMKKIFVSLIVIIAIISCSKEDYQGLIDGFNYCMGDVNK